MVINHRQRLVSKQEMIVSTHVLIEKRRIKVLMVLLGWGQFDFFGAGPRAPGLDCPDG